MDLLGSSGSGTAPVSAAPVLPPVSGLGPPQFYKSSALPYEFAGLHESPGLSLLPPVEKGPPLFTPPPAPVENKKAPDLRNAIIDMLSSNRGIISI